MAGKHRRAAKCNCRLHCENAKGLNTADLGKNMCLGGWPAYITEYSAKVGILHDPFEKPADAQSE